MRVGLFANDPFGSYVFDAIREGPGDLVCVVGETASLKGRLRKKVRRLVKHPTQLLGMVRGRFSAEVEPPRSESRSLAAGLASLRAVGTAHGLPFFEDYRLADESFAGVLRSFDLDLILVTTFGAILRPHIIDVPRRGLVNFHFALLPKYRGMTPELCCLLGGATETGVTAHFIDTGVDTGDIIAQSPVSIGDTDGFAELQAMLYPAGRELVRTVLQRFAAGEVQAQAQDHASATTCQLPAGFREISPAQMTGEQIRNILRACLGTRFAPYVVRDDGQRLFLLEAEFVQHGDGAPAPAASWRCRDGVLIARRTWTAGRG